MLNKLNPALKSRRAAIRKLFIKVRAKSTRLNPALKSSRAAIKA
jgi:hypothetical protein